MFTATQTEKQKSDLTAGRGIRENRDMGGKEIDVEALTTEVDEKSARGGALRIFGVSREHESDLVNLSKRKNFDVVYEKETTEALKDATEAKEENADIAA